MPGGRRTTPLFDLLTRHEPAASQGTAVREPVPEIRPAKPVVRVELKPREIPAEPPPPREAPAPYTAGIRMPTNALYVIVAIMLALVVAAIAIGWQMGKNRQAQTDEQFMRRPAPTLSEPGTDNPEVSRIPVEPNRTATGKATQPSPQPAQTGDPREKGLNYLYLAVLNQSEAERAGAFLRENGVEAYAVAWVDPKGGSANNAAPLYRLFVAPGVAGPDLKKSAAQNLQAEVARLGKVWQQEHRGTSNFGKLSWEKFQ